MGGKSTIPHAEKIGQEIQEEILSVVEEGEKEGVVDEEEREMILSVISFRDTTSGQIMTPRPEVIHEIGRSSDRRPKRMIVMHHQSAYRYFSRNSAFGLNPVGNLLLASGLTIRAGLTLARNEGIRWKARLRPPR